jgi:hypothetical protein
MRRSRDRLVRDSLRERFVVTLTDGTSFEGLLAEADDRTVVLVDAWALSASGRAEVDGRLFLPRDHVAYMQVPQ